MNIVGIDEVGRGCWAGPLVAGAVCFNESYNHSKQTPWTLRDSKLLTKRQLQLSDKGIKASAVAYGIGWVSPAEVDEFGLTISVGLAMRRALACIQDDYGSIIIDGNYNFLADNQLAMTLVKADASIPSVSAASIVAKVARDNYMTHLARLYPEYGFDKHVGYGTALHRLKLQEHGVSNQHRLSYRPIKALLQ